MKKIVVYRDSEGKLWEEFKYGNAIGKYIQEIDAYDKIIFPHNFREISDNDLKQMSKEVIWKENNQDQI